VKRTEEDDDERQDDATGRVKHWLTHEQQHVALEQHGDLGAEAGDSHLAVIVLFGDLEENNTTWQGLKVLCSY